MLNKNRGRGRSKGRQDAAPKVSPQKVLALWVVAVADFRCQYIKVSQFLNSLTLRQTFSHETKWVGQCSVNQLMDLQVTMRSELEQLLREAEHFDQLTNAKNYEKLVDHARLLEHLNKQANDLLELASLPAS